MTYTVKCSMCGALTHDLVCDECKDTIRQEVSAIAKNYHLDPENVIEGMMDYFEYYHSRDRVCSMCGEVKDISQFYFDKTNRKHSCYCKDCQRLYNRDRKRIQRAREQDEREMSK